MNEFAGFPALFAPASLKHELEDCRKGIRLRFSGAFCAGLIEALGIERSAAEAAGFPALFAPASLKPNAGRALP